MSWLSNARRRAKEGLLQAVGAHTATEDVEFDNSYRNFANHVNELQKLKQLMELWVESYESFCAASLLLSNAWKAYYDNSHVPGEAASQVPIQYQLVSNEMDKLYHNMQEHVSPVIKSAFTTRCIKPIVNILSVVPNVQELIQERRTLLLDFDSYKSKIQKEHAAGRDSYHPNVIKKAAKLDESAKKLHNTQLSITKTFHEFEVARPQSLGAELSAFLACVHSFAYNLCNATSKLLPILPQSAATLAIIDYNVNCIAQASALEERESVSIPAPLSLPEAIPVSASTNAIDEDEHRNSVLVTATIVEVKSETDEAVTGRQDTVTESERSRVSSVDHRSTRASGRFQPTTISNSSSEVDKIAKVDSSSDKVRNSGSMRLAVSPVKEDSNVMMSAPPSVMTHGSPPPKPPRSRPTSQRDLQPTNTAHLSTSSMHSVESISVETTTFFPSTTATTATTATAASIDLHLPETINETEEVVVEEEVTVNNSDGDNNDGIHDNKFDSDDDSDYVKDNEEIKTDEHESCWL